MSTPRILLWDLETSNLDADFGGLLCIGYKALGDRRAKVIALTDFPQQFTKDSTNDKCLVRAALGVLQDADVWVTHFGTYFDLPFLRSRLLYHKLPTLPPIPHVDTWAIAKKRLRLHSNRLASVSGFLGLEEKTPLKGPMWVRARAGHRPSLRYVVQHCRQDVEVLEQAYVRIRALWPLHPSTALILGRPKACPSCGGLRLQARGLHVAKTQRYQRFACQGCGAWCRTPVAEPRVPQMIAL